MREFDGDAYRYACAGAEPCIEEMLSDPIVHAVLRRDSLTADDVRRAIHHARAKIRDRRAHANYALEFAPAEFAWCGCVTV